MPALTFVVARFVAQASQVVEHAAGSDKLRMNNEMTIGCRIDIVMSMSSPPLCLHKVDIGALGVSATSELKALTSTLARFNDNELEMCGVHRTGWFCVLVPGHDFSWVQQADMVGVRVWDVETPLSTATLIATHRFLGIPDGGFRESRCYGAREHSLELDTQGSSEALQTVEREEHLIRSQIDADPFGCTWGNAEDEPVALAAAHHVQ